MTNLEIFLIVWNLINTILAVILFLWVLLPGGIKDKIKQLIAYIKLYNKEIHQLKLKQIDLESNIYKINKEIEELNRYNALKENPQLEEQETPNTKTINIKDIPPSKDDPIQKILNTKLKLNKEDTEKLANGMTECMQSLDRIGEAISNAFKDAIDERNKINQNKSNNEIYYKLIEKYGNQQIIVSIEELAELQKELCKHLRDKTNKKAIIEEICDVQIMLEQLILYFDISPLDLDSVKRWKLERTKERMLTNETEEKK